MDNKKYYSSDQNINPKSFPLNLIFSKINNPYEEINYVIKNNRRYGLLGTKNCINVSDSIQ